MVLIAIADEPSDAKYQWQQGSDDPYLTRRRWDFFVRHLMGEQPPEGFRIAGP